MNMSLKHAGFNMKSVAGTNWLLNISAFKWLIAVGECVWLLEKETKALGGYFSEIQALSLSLSDVFQGGMVKCSASSKAIEDCWYR